jgi:hypothetical protein
MCDYPDPFSYGTAYWAGLRARQAQQAPAYSISILGGVAYLRVPPVSSHFLVETVSIPVSEVIRLFKEVRAATRKPLW